MCKFSYYVYTVCAHLVEKRHICAQRFVLKTKSRCSVFKTTEIKLGWCPKCFQWIKSAHEPPRLPHYGQGRKDPLKKLRLRLHHRELNPRDPQLIQNYWAWKSWMDSDRPLRQLVDMPFSLLDADEPIAYRIAHNPPRHDKDKDSIDDYLRTGLGRLNCHLYHVPVNMRADPPGLPIAYEKEAMIYTICLTDADEVKFSLMKNGGPTYKWKEVIRYIDLAAAATISCYAKEAPKATSVYPETIGMSMFPSSSEPCSAKATGDLRGSDRRKSVEMQHAPWWDSGYRASHRESEGELPGCEPAECTWTPPWGPGDEVPRQDFGGQVPHEEPGDGSEESISSEISRPTALVSAEAGPEPTRVALKGVAKAVAGFFRRRKATSGPDCQASDDKGADEARHELAAPKPANLDKPLPIPPTLPASQDEQTTQSPSPVWPFLDGGLEDHAAEEPEVDVPEVEEPDEDSKLDPNDTNWTSVWCDRHHTQESDRCASCILARNNRMRREGILVETGLIHSFPLQQAQYGADNSRRQVLVTEAGHLDDVASQQGRYTSGNSSSSASNGHCARRSG